MSTESSKAGFPFPGEPGETPGGPRRWSLRERLSALFSQLESGNRAAAAARVAAGTDREALRQGTEREALRQRTEREALRQRLTPTNDAVESAFALASRRPGLPRHDAYAEWSGASLSDLPWPGGIPDPEWKPVMLAEGEAAPALPTLDELAAEAGIPPSAPRFPLDS